MTETETNLKTEYSGIEIQYLEESNKWEFTLRGRTRTADSLAKAKEFIDKQPKPKVAFQPFSAYRQAGWKARESGELYDTVEVTSFAGTSHGYGSGNRREWWIRNSEDRREKVWESELFVINGKNAAIIDRLKALTKERENLNKRETELKNEMQMIAPTPDMDTEEA